MSNAEDTGSIPDWGTKIPQAVGQLSPLAPTTESPDATMKTQHGQKFKKKKKQNKKNQNAENERPGQYNPRPPITLLRSETLLFFFFSWRIIALQCCAGFC